MRYTVTQLQHCRWTARIAWRGMCLVRLSSSENQGGLSSEPGSVTWALGLADSGCIAICPAIRSHGWGTGGLSGGFSLLRAEFNMARQVAETSLDMLDIAWCFWKGCSWRKAEFATNGQAFMSVYNSTCFLGATLAKHQALWKMRGLAAFFRAWRCLIFGEYLSLKFLLDDSVPSVYQLGGTLSEFRQTGHGWKR